ncbi:MAG: N-acetylneuraminate synthase family protein [Sedimenticola sp.]
MKIQLTEKVVLSDFCKPYIIAELGSNHNGDMELAKRLIDAAKEAGADCVKFQSWSKESIFSRKTYEDNYFLSDDYRDRDDYTLEKIVDDYSISSQELLDMKRYADEVGIDCTSTPFSKVEVDFLVNDLGADFIKVASMDLNNYPLLKYMAEKGKPMLLSTGLSNLAEIDSAIRTIEAAGNQRIVILHCVSIYPPEDTQVNLRNMDTLSQAYSYPVGFSDHTLGTCVPLAAVARGACVIEKHFTLDKEMDGWDHKVSATPVEMKSLVNDVRRIYNSLGTGRIDRVENEERVEAFRRSIVAAKAIGEGDLITEEMIDFKRPGIGLPPDAMMYLVGKKAKRYIAFDELIEFEDF